MNSQNKKSIGTKVLSAQTSQLAGRASGIGHSNALSKNSVAQSIKRPVAPPAYRPQSKLITVQQKTSRLRHEHGTNQVHHQEKCNPRPHKPGVIEPKKLALEASTLQPKMAGPLNARRTKIPPERLAPPMSKALQLTRAPVPAYPKTKVSSTSVVQRAEKSSAEKIRQRLGGFVVAQNADCVICQEPLGADRVRLSCGHEFHRDCLDEAVTGALGIREQLGLPRPSLGAKWYKCPLCNKLHSLLQIATAFDFAKKPDKKDPDGGKGGGGSASSSSSSSQSSVLVSP